MSSACARGNGLSSDDNYGTVEPRVGPSFQADVAPLESVEGRGTEGPGRDEVLVWDPNAVWKASKVVDVLLRQAEQTNGTDPRERKYSTEHALEALYQYQAGSDLRLSHVTHPTSVKPLPRATVTDQLHHRKLRLQIGRDYVIREAGGLGYKSVRRRCMELEKECFVASERLNIDREAEHKCGNILFCAMVQGSGDEEVAGYLLLHRARPATVAKLAVAPRHRRQGVGRALLEAALDWFCDMALYREPDDCFLQVDEANAAARLLYESAGFRVVHRREHFYCNLGKPRTSDCESGVGCRHALEMRRSFLQ